MYCIHCGVPTSEDASFCGSCGKPIVRSQNPPTPATPPQRVPDDKQESSEHGTVPPLPLAEQPSQPHAPYTVAAAEKRKPVLWILAGFGACLLILITVAIGVRLSQSSSQPDNSVSNTAPETAPTSETPAYTPPATDSTPAPVSAPVQTPPPPPPAAQSSIVGDWKTTTVAGTSIALHFGADGRYVLRDFISDEGVYVFSTGDGTLRLQSNSMFSKGIMVWSCQLSGDSFSCVDPDGAGHVYSRIQ